MLKRLSLAEQAKAVLLEAIRLEPFLWAAWLELAHHNNDRDTIDAMDLPNHWIKSLFIAHSYVEIHLNQQALEIYFALREAGLANSTYLQAQVSKT